MKNAYHQFNSTIDNFIVLEQHIIAKLNSNIIEREPNVDNAVFSIAIEQERRNVFLLFFSFLIKQIDIINIFFFQGDFEVIPISICSYLLSVVADFTMNALLFSDDVISAKYHNNGKVNQMTSLILSMLSNLLGYIFGVCINKLTNYSPSLELFSKEAKNISYYIIKFKKLIKIIKIKLTIFFVLDIIFMIAFVYFLSSFCSVYHGSQWNWFINGITGIGISLIITCIIAFVITMLRYLGLCCKSEQMYNASLYLSRD